MCRDGVAYNDLGASLMPAGSPLSAWCRNTNMETNTKKSNYLALLLNESAHSLYLMEWVPVAVSRILAE